MRVLESRREWFEYWYGGGRAGFARRGYSVERIGCAADACACRRASGWRVHTRDGGRYGSLRAVKDLVGLCGGDLDALFRR